MRIVLITDLHTSREGNYPFDIDVRKNLQRVLSEVKAIRPDLLVVTGDLSMKEGDLEIYRWQKLLFDNVEAPYLLLAGNHDDQQMMHQVFEGLDLRPTGEIYGARTYASNTLLYLDSARGLLSKEQKRWLGKQIMKHNGQYLVIFMHHPPHLLSVPHMDNAYALQDREEVMQILFQAGLPVHVFCGHYHGERTLAAANVTIYLTPSLFFQIDPSVEEFAIEHHDIAYRIIDLQPDHILTSLQYLRHR